MRHHCTFRRLLSNLTVSIVSVLAFFSIAEILTRLFWHHSIRQENIGIKLEGSNRSAIIGGIEYRLNSIGLRMNKEISKEKPKGGKRILALGDSFLFGDGLQYEELVSERIEEYLNNKNNTVEVINAGRAGFNTHDELNQLLRLGPMCRPDLVIVFFFTNDVIKNSLDSTKASWQQRAKEYMRTKSKFFAYCYSVYKDKLVSLIGVPKDLLPPEYFNLNDDKPGWLEFKQATLQIKKTCQELDADLIFVIIPTLTNLNNRYPYAELREKTVKYLCECNIRNIDLFNVFAPYKPSELWVSLENTHWNGLGTALAANDITDYIIKNRVLEPSE
jgi:hypothetical protein